MEIYCPIGKITVNLPENAFGTDLLDAEYVAITPCAGCKKEKHVEFYDHVSNDLEMMKKTLYPKAKPVEMHHVAVGKDAEGNMTVACSCECEIQINPKD